MVSRPEMVSSPDRPAGPALVGRHTMGPANPAAAHRGAGTPAWVSAAALWSVCATAFRTLRAASAYVVAMAAQGPDRARRPGRADHHRGDRQCRRRRKCAAGRRRFPGRRCHAHPHGHTQPGADAPRGEKEHKATGDPGYRAGNDPGASSHCSGRRAVTSSSTCSGRRAVTSSSRYVRWLPPAERRRHLLQTRRILPRCRPRGIRDSWRWEGDHLRRQRRLALGAIGLIPRL
jgi:hypothetical protein